jgi:EamA-like transporter family.
LALPHLTGDGAICAYGTGLALTVSIVSYYRALAGGPVGVGVPTFGVFIASSSLIGTAVLDEPLTARKIAGTVLAVAAVSLMSVE